MYWRVFLPVFLAAFCHQKFSYTAAVENSEIDFAHVEMLSNSASAGHPVVRPRTDLYDARSGRRRRTVDTAKKSLTMAERGAFLAIHNSLRAGVSPSAADMAFMVWDKDLESMAQEWADKCAFKHGQPTRNPAPYTWIGQNLWTGTGGYDTASATTSWYNEVSDYTYSSLVCTPGKMCGHYTQVVWSASVYIGCGITYCPTVSGFTNNAYLMVCNYGPGGNYQGAKPYVSGTPCSSCATAYPACNNGLCSASSLCSVVTQCKPTNMTNCLCDASFYGAGHKLQMSMTALLTSMSLTMFVFMISAASTR